MVIPSQKGKTPSFSYDICREHLLYINNIHMTRIHELSAIIYKYILVSRISLKAAQSLIVY